ncbi:photosynthetic complex putative assembly protein PuhB [Hyphomonas sp.]|uniref:photosynthetic complex putative assembly protein PuhB n=1 Tax=Hyphomonas sp. TaxID=87 RepID=UPI00391947BA
MIGFHDEEDGGGEPVRGLPQALPEGERLIWQGRPDALAFAVHVFHIRFVLAYFVIAAAWRMAHAASIGETAALGGIAANTVLSAVIGLGLVFLIAWAMARAAIYTITSKRIVLRYGVALPKYVSLPFAQLASADMRTYGSGKGDIRLTLSTGGGLSYMKLWPFVRPLHISRPQPMLRGLKDAASVSVVLARAISAHAPDKVRVKAAPAPAPAANPALPGITPSLT